MWATEENATYATNFIARKEAGKSREHQRLCGVLHGLQGRSEFVCNFFDCLWIIRACPGNGITRAISFTIWNNRSGWQSTPLAPCSLSSLYLSRALAVRKK